MNKDDKCFYSITRKAKLTQKLNEIYKNKTKQFDELAEYIGKIKAKFNDQNEIRISCSSIIVNIVFIAEAFIKDILEVIIYSNSKAIEYEKIEIKRIVDLNNISKIIFNAAESYCYKYF